VIDLSSMRLAARVRLLKHACGWFEHATLLPRNSKAAAVPPHSKATALLLLFAGKPALCLCGERLPALGTIGHDGSRHRWQRTTSAGAR
jgi:hypothetical protein